MLNKNAFSIRRNPLTERKPIRLQSAQDFPDVPVLPETMLFLDLMIQEPCVNLREVSQLVLSDLGATLQVLRLAASEYGDAEGRPMRMEDCISDLGLQECLEAISRKMLPRDDSQHEIAQLWAHAREIAHEAKLIAEETPDVNPEEAHLCGLLHVIGLLPPLLRWRKTGVADGLPAGLMLSKQWCLPQCVMEYFEADPSDCATQLHDVVHRAHRGVGRSTIPCPLGRSIGLTLVGGRNAPPAAQRVQ